MLRKTPKPMSGTSFPMNRDALDLGNVLLVWLRSFRSDVWLKHKRDAAPELGFLLALKTETQTQLLFVPDFTNLTY